MGILSFPEEVFGILVSPGGDEVYVGSSWPQAGVRVLDAATMLETKHLALPINEITDLVQTPQGQFVAVGQRSVCVMSPSGTLLTSIRLGGMGFDGANVNQVEVSADGALAAITGDSLWVIDLQTMTLQASVDLHGLPSEGLAISPDHARAYVAQPGQRTTVVDLEQGVIESTMQTTFPAGQRGPANGGQADVALLPGGNTLLRSLTCCEVVAIMSVATGQPLGSIPLGPGPTEIKLSPDGQTAWVIAAGNLKEVDLASGTVKSVIRVQDFSIHLALLYP